MELDLIIENSGGLVVGRGRRGDDDVVVETTAFENDGDDQCQTEERDLEIKDSDGVHRWWILWSHEQWRWQWRLAGVSSAADVNEHGLFTSGKKVGKVNTRLSLICYCSIG